MPGDSAAELTLPPGFTTNYLVFRIFSLDQSKPVQLKIGLIGCFAMKFSTTASEYTSITPPVPVQSMCSSH